ncbi:GNAT family N-acetyltransferase [Streptomyces tagetis]|uniref:Lysine N-acyltransferase MbtK n=1 Tax=Streptomyces tagetis TaxID=2820809 RepID=A0A941B262_9ACTN|nr:GNAT family N-acetyltransferase [Streptomyces sp. RG38]MBQ0829135.1 GNAT family N-acetyltransferase [Streptomyces sp. RG38]
MRTMTAGIGALTLRPLDPLTDAELVHGWLTHPRATGPERALRLVDVERACMRTAADPHRAAFLGLHDGVPAFLVETSVTAHREAPGGHPAEPGDLGLRFTLAPDAPAGRGFAGAALTATLAHLFADPAVRRIVAAPRPGDPAGPALHAALGFVPASGRAGEGAPPRLCTRERFEEAVFA